MKQELRAALDALGPESGRIFTQIFPDAAASSEGALSGLQISVKDNIDVAGYTTAAASWVFRDHAPAREDAPVVQRLRAAGAVIFAKTNMSEFAYSTHGINAHYGMPANPHDSHGPRIPGGSSSGAGVAVARGLGEAAIGTDTAGSVRIPAALCGVVGLKPRQRRIPRQGVVPLSESLDCVGVIARSVERVARVFEAIADEDRDAPPRERGRRLKIAVPSGAGSPTDGLRDESVMLAFEKALQRLALDPRFELIPTPLPLIGEGLALATDGGISAPEAFAFHRPYLERSRHLYDPFTLYRLGFGERCSEERYRGLLARRRAAILRTREELGEYDAIAFPTCPIVAPRVADVGAADVLAAVNAQLLRHTVPANVLDLASITLPCAHLHPMSAGPVGLSLDSVHGEEGLLEAAAAVEQAIS
ncbi:MAG TPA: amidase family protein [Steroidobacteraceae bacterium]|nr:amidase family protein [Steroidobacteraceae bacterium]